MHNRLCQATLYLTSIVLVVADLEALPYFRSRARSAIRV